MKYSINFDCGDKIIRGEMSFNDAFPDATVPDLCKSGEDIVFSIIPSSLSEIQIGDDLIKFTFYRTDNTYNGHYLDDVVGEYYVKSNRSGYIHHTYLPCDYTLDELSRKVDIYSSFEELIRDKYPIDFEIKKDEFTSERWIDFKWSGISERESFLAGHRLSVAYRLEFSTDNNLPVLVFRYSTTHVKVHKKDTLSFKFEDGTVLQLPVLNAPVRSNNKENVFAASVPLTTDEIVKFSTTVWERMRIDHINGESASIIENMRNHKYDEDSSGLFSRTIFKIYAQSFSQALLEMGIVPKKRMNIPNPKDITSYTQDESCYVYLMVDTSNGYHKIGISNHPDYREKTLQSEKPSIEKICAKKFPSRIIAQSIESALHTAFAAKRIRGEWFHLSEKDVAQLIETLK